MHLFAVQPRAQQHLTLEQYTEAAHFSRREKKIQYLYTTLITMDSIM